MWCCGSCSGSQIMLWNFSFLMSPINSFLIRLSLIVFAIDNAVSKQIGTQNTHKKMLACCRFELFLYFKKEWLRSAAWRNKNKKERKVERWGHFWLAERLFYLFDILITAWSFRNGNNSFATWGVFLTKIQFHWKTSTLFSDIYIYSPLFECCQQSMSDAIAQFWRERHR